MYRQYHKEDIVPCLFGPVSDCNSLLGTGHVGAAKKAYRAMETSMVLRLKNIMLISDQAMDDVQISSWK